MGLTDVADALAVALPDPNALPDPDALGAAFSARKPFPMKSQLGRRKGQEERAGVDSGKIQNGFKQTNSELPECYCHQTNLKALQISANPQTTLKKPTLI